MKNVALIYSGYDKGLSSLEHNRNGVTQKLRDFGGWEIEINRPLESELQFAEDIDNYKDVEIDSLLIYYTGHGRHFGVNRTFQLQLSEKIGITLETLYGHILENFESLPNKIAIVVDACYSGKAIYDTTQFGTSEILTSSLADKQSFEVGFPKEVRSKMSLFSHYFCDAIETLQLELEEINLLNIRTHINGQVSVQTTPYSFLTERDKGLMTIAKGTLQKQNHGDVSIISVHFYPNNDNYEIVINNNLLMSVPFNKIESSEVEQKIVDNVKRLLNSPVESRVELILPKELYGKTFPLWRKIITSESETWIRSHSKKELAKNWLPTLKTRWGDSLKVCQNMSFGHEDVSVKVDKEAMRDSIRIAAIIKKRVEDKSVFDGLDDHYFIALWINNCEHQESYEHFKNSVSQSTLISLSKSIRKEVVNNASNCASNINFMWDDPHTIVQKKEKYG